MSGFEIAGIVLGAFPIAITTIDSYGKVARTVRAWKDIRVAYTRCSEDLKNEQLVFKRHLRELVLPLVVDGNSANELLADPSSQRWKDADVSELLQKKLGESHILYLGFVRRMEETLAELSKEMALDSDLVQERMDAQVWVTCTGSLRCSAVIIAALSATCQIPYSRSALDHPIAILHLLCVFNPSLAIGYCMESPVLSCLPFGAAD